MYFLKAIKVEYTRWLCWNCYGQQYTKLSECAATFNLAFQSDLVIRTKKKKKTSNMTVLAWRTILFIKQYLIARLKGGGLPEVFH